MAYKYVRNSDWNDGKLSTINIQAVCIQHKYELYCLMHDALQSLNMKGSLELLCTNELIVAFQYIYASKAELRLNIKVCKKLFEVASDFYRKQVNDQQIHFYSI